MMNSISSLVVRRRRIANGQRHARCYSLRPRAMSFAARGVAIHTATGHTAAAVHCTVVADATLPFGAIGCDLSGYRHVTNIMAATWCRRGIVHYPDGDRYVTVDTRRRRDIDTSAAVGRRDRQGRADHRWYHPVQCPAWIPGGAANGLPAVLN